MPESSMVGSRIRERRILSGLRQTELAQQAGISPSYLNLIEHNRRRIAGKTLLKLAEALEVEPSLLSEGAEATLIAGLREAAGDNSSDGAELERIEEFAGRFPGWARLLTDQFRRSETLEQTVQTLTDRLAHDPHLADSLHEVISTVTAIRSTASILVDIKELEPEWRARFHRNINEDSRRLAEGAEALVRYLESAPDTEAEIRSPQDELHAFLSDNGYRFDDLENGGGEAAIERLVESGEGLTSEAGRSLARAALHGYRSDAEALPRARLEAAVAKHGVAPARLCEELQMHAACVFRRLVSVSPDLAGPVGLVTCDGSGSLIFRKPIDGFAVPRAAGGCALWPLFQVLGQPLQAVEARITQAGRDRETVTAYAVAEQVSPAGFGQMARYHAHMLLVPDRARGSDTPARDVGVTCRVCPLNDCPARREPSIIAKGF